MSPLKIALFAAAIATLAACATPQSLAPGTTVDEARARLGIRRVVSASHWWHRLQYRTAVRSVVGT